jgi:hypothetical protein
MYSIKVDGRYIFHSPNLVLVNNFAQKYLNTSYQIVFNRENIGETSGESPIETGSNINFTLGNLFDAYSSRDGVTNTEAFNTNNGCWQLYYAHQNISIPSGNNNIGLNPHTSGTNAWTWYYAISNSTNTIGDWSSVSALTTSRSGSYTGGVITYSNIISTINIPANTYFLIGNTSGPFYRTIKELSESRTAIVSGSPYVTAINQVCLGNWPSGGTTTIPSQFNGAGSGYTFYDGYAHVHSVKFS